MAPLGDLSADVAPVAIVGAGSIGTGWAIVFATAGRPVRLHDTAPERLAAARTEIGARLADLQEFGLLAEPPATILARIACTPDLAQSVAGAGHVQECVPEELELKRAVFAALDACSPADCPIASSSSFMTASALAGELPGRQRCLVVHPGNPPYLLRVAEIVPAPFTSAAVVARTERLLRDAGIEPVRVRARWRGSCSTGCRVRSCARPMRWCGMASPAWPTSIASCVTGWACAGRWSGRSRPWT